MTTLTIKKALYTRCPSRVRPYWDRLEASPLGARLARGAFWSLAGTTISQGLTLVASIFVARMLGKEIYGELGIIRSTVGMFGVMAGFGLGLTATKHVAECRHRDPERAGRIMALSGLVALATGMAAALVLFGSAPWLAEHTLAAPALAGPLRIGSLMLLLSAMNGTQTGALAGFEAFKTIAQVNLLIGLASFPMLLIGTYLGGLTGTVWALVINLAVAWLLNHLALRREAARCRVPFKMAGCSQEWGVLGGFALPAALSSLLVVPTTWSCGAMLVNQPGGYAELGVFSAALIFQSVLLFMGGVINAPLLSLLSHENPSGENRLQQINVLSSWLCGLLPALPLLCFPELSTLVLGSEFASTLPQTLPIVMLYTCIMLYKQGLARVLAVKSLMWWSVASNAVWAIALLASASLLTRYGAVGLASAYALAYGLNTLLFFPLYLHKGLVPRGSIWSAEAGLTWVAVVTAALLGASECSIALRAVYLPLALSAIVACAIRLGRPMPARPVAKRESPDGQPSPAAKSNVVHAVVEHELCSGCGVCVGLCPRGALDMQTGDTGDLTCVMAGTCATGCGICTDVCPFSRSVHNPRPRNVALFGDANDPSAQFHPNIGWHRRSILGYRRDPVHRAASASGGLATWCLEKLLQHGEVTRVAVVRFAQDRRKAFFEFHAASTIEEIRQASGSVYHPVEISSIVREILAGQERWAVVGVPCLCAAIRNSSRLTSKVPYVLGLACGMYQNTYYTEMLLSQSGIYPAEATGIHFRNKAPKGPASDFRFQGTSATRPGKPIPYHGLPLFLGRHGYFRYQACNYCMDVFAETADACFMDAWLPEFVRDPKGTSLAVLRNQYLDALFQSVEARRELCLDDTTPERVVQSQQVHVRRKQELIHFRHPRHASPEAPVHATRRERLEWWLQQRTQRRSKAAWGRYGRRYGRFVFWAVMLDLLLAQLLLVQAPSRLLSLPRRVVRKAARWFR
jgi:O-antigen/teichoic acid export membrane protein/coenzyme F420-reducing hydrogenase beta subunit